MIYVTGLQRIVASWQDRLEHIAYPKDYTDALSECIYELNNFINKSIEEELDYQEMADQLAAEFFSSTEEAEDVA